jgi:hypothetical protein
MQHQESATRYKIGDIVPVSGAYLCIPCGYVQEFDKGTLFITCEACFAGTSNGPEGYQEVEAEFWELLP